MDVLNKFTNCYNDLMEFEDTQASSKAEDNIHSLEVLRVHLEHLWTQVSRAYEICRDFQGTVGEQTIDLKKLREKYRKALTAYKNSLGSINAEKDTLKPIESSCEKSDRTLSDSPTNPIDNVPPYSIRLPPCDTDVFCGSYKTWPTFRDLFSAIYINNPRLSKVEKLYHLSQKTDGEAREIISHIPLTHEGFDIAWNNLLERYENKCMQVNEQIKLLFALPSVSVSSSCSLKLLQRTVNGCLQSLKTLNIEIKTWDPILIYLCSTRLPRNYLEDFENTLADSSQMPTWYDFDNFLTQRFKTLESVGNVHPQTSKSSYSLEINRQNIKHKGINSFQTNINHNGNQSSGTSNDIHCPNCNDSHILRNCPNFLGKSINDRIHIVKTTNSCYNCLGIQHGVKDCKSRYTCRICHKRHNTLLHKGNEHQNTPLDLESNAHIDHNTPTLTTTIQSTSNQQATNLTSLCIHDNKKSSVNQRRETLLFTALVQIEINNQRFAARAIIDPGSQSSFISEKLKNRLGLPTKQNIIHVSGLNPSVTETSTKAAIFKLCSRLNNNFKLDVWAPVIKTLPFNLPPRNLDINSLEKTLQFPLADPHFYISQPIDLLLGIDLCPFIYDLEIPMRTLGSLLTQKTVFGWIVGGPIDQPAFSKPTISLCNTTALDELLTKFWEVEETSKTIVRSEEDKTCENIYKNSTYRDNTGRYVVTMPFREEENIGHSRNIAMAQFHRLEKILNTKPDIKEQYDQVMLEYLELGHMKKVLPTEIVKTPNFYLPHHAVIKPDRLTTKLRVVFNASCPSSNKKSLNDILYSGPILQQDLVVQILKWRFFQYVYNADITKMYRQIIINPSQTQYQRILFRKSSNEPIEDFELQTVTFGVNCAPFLAIRTLLQLAEDIKDTYPLASKILRENMYVDDVLAGGHELDETIASRHQLTKTLTSAGFDLMKWASNDPRVINDLPSDKLLSSDCLHFSENLGTKTLGIKWNISSDTFAFPQPIIETMTTFTKRDVLSAIAKFFDPCGWLAPIIIVAKIIMQQIWLDKTKWDDDLTPLTCNNWKDFLKNSPTIENIKIPRWIQYTPNCDIEIHGFCDSSEKAYAAALYLRVHSDCTITSHLLVAKTRIAPIKKLSLPRLELCGAVLLAKLAASILPNLQLTQYNIHFWTDSTIVLAWLNKPPCAWNTFVGNRVSEIVDKVGIENWRHIDSHSNPADIATRGCSSSELETFDLWWYGPSWLRSSKQNWPKSTQINETHLEQKSTKVLMSTTFVDPLDRFSTLSKAYRVLAYVFRFWRNTGQNRHHLRIKNTEISIDEIRFIKNRLVATTQQHYFSEEYNLLKRKKKIPSTSSLLTLNPFLDTTAIIRANGRLSQSPTLTYNERHPILLPYNSRLSRLLVEQTHKTTLHGGNQLMIRSLRTEFWIFRLKPLVKLVINHCKTCTLYKQQTQHQIMASLPPERTEITRPFHNTGVDYAGPFTIKTFTGRACRLTKGYACLFVCFSTKAIHLEAVSDLSSQAFLAAFTRFIGRRGCPAQVFSDNGTNFVGAAEMLRKDRISFFKQLQQTVVEQYSHQNLEWKFIPPGAPHIGGLWEAGVKSFKTHLKKVMPDMKFTFEEFATILTRIESCLNSRPLSPASDDPTDFAPLTPGHFLIGASLLTPAEPDISDDNLAVANRWKRLKIISQQFCQRWKVEYLKELHRRYKWKRQEENVKVNDLVVIKDEKLPQNEWRLGRIIQLYPGVDENSRVVDIKTSSGTIRRSITKLIPLLSH